MTNEKTTNKKPPLVAIIGRTNVGKSTLFNRLAEEQKALVSAIPGTTRDRNYANCLWRGRVIRIVDTGGLDVDLDDEIEKGIEKQSKLAVKQADLILLVVDLKDGLMPQDFDLAKSLWKSKKPIIVVGNKADSEKYFYEAKGKGWQKLQLGEISPTSALQGSGVGDLLEEVYKKLEAAKKPPLDASEYTAINVILVGKPNVGKSSIINAIVGEERFITSPIAHTTREPNDTLVEFKNKNYVFVDTAGMRKKAKVRKTRGLEAAGVKKTIKTIDKADIAFFILDISKPIEQQDKHLASLLIEANLGVIIVANKWDLIPEKEVQTAEEYKKYIYNKLPFLRWAPIIFTSAETKQRITKLFPLIDSIQKERCRYITENALSRFLNQAIKKHKPARGKGVAYPKIMRLRQIKTAPPIFEIIIKSKKADVLHKSYLKFLENRLREKHGFAGTPLRISIKTYK